ncbi:MAG: RHS repeat-associated core domain-containing protein [Blastocatellia bacterium]|nr:RHS repeat-associated core domain-containing protein [Blastocatellia bacterium]
MKKALFILSLSLLLAAFFLIRPGAGGRAQQTPLQDSPLLRAADQAWEREEWEQAVAQYRQFIQQTSSHPALAEAHYKIGYYLSFAASPEEAIAEYENAIRLQPKAELIHEAKEGIAALRYFQGRYEEAQSLFAEIMRETDDWATFKESAHRFKEMTHLVALQKLPVKRSALDCGPRALEFACNQMGVRAASVKLKPLYETRGKGVSLQQLRDASTRAGLPAWGVRVNRDQLDKVPTPFIAHLRNHYWVVTKADRERVEYVDPDRGPSYLTTKLFLERWRGDALVFGKNRPSSLIAQALGAAELNTVSGGHHLHGDNNGSGAENPNTGIYNQNSCPAGGGGSSVGLPRWSVNLANYNLIVQDTDFVYGGRGPSVGLTRTYNADASFESVFGRSWTFNYNIHLVFEPRGMVTVVREGGKKDSFSPRGDGTHTPPRWTHDRLIKNPDGTYRLIRKRSRATQHFNAQGRLVRITDRNDNSVTLQYQGDRLISVTDAVGRVTRFRYNAGGKIDEVTDPLGRKATFGYDANGNLISYVDMANQQVSYTYDRRGYMSSLTTPGGTTLFKLGTTPQFGDRPYVLKEIVEPDGNVTRFDTGNEIAWFTNPQGVQTFVFNDSNGETTEIEDGLGNKSKSEYGSAGMTRFTDARGVSVSYAYDNQANLVRITDPLSVVTTFAYDANENVKEIKSSAGRSATFDYDGKGNVTKATDPKKGVTIFDYDGFGQLLKITDPRRNEITFTYDDKGNRKSFATPESTANYTYDEIGRLESLTDPAGNTFRYSFDGIDRPLSLTAPDGKRTAYSYNCCKLSSITDVVGTLRFDYYPSGRLRHFTDTFNQTISYSYDKNGNLLTLTYPDGKVVKYEYDVNNRMKKVADWLGNSTIYDYDEAGKLISVSNSNGTRAGYKYDSGNRLLFIANVRSNGTPISMHKYEPNSYGSLIKSIIIPPAAMQAAPRGTNYNYDGENKLLSTANAILNYDLNGNLVSIKGSESADLRFDYFNRLIEVINPSHQYHYQYDAIGTRISRSIDGSTTKYATNPNASLSQVLSEAGPLGAISSYYVYGIGLAWKISASGTSYFYHYDGNANTMAITDQGAASIYQYSYDSFGNSTSNGIAPLANEFKFAGGLGVFDEGNGLTYMRARYYKASLGRFISKDPIGISGGANVYRYAYNDPINKTDPTGLVPDWINRLGFGECCGASRDCSQTHSPILNAQQQACAVHDRCLSDTGFGFQNILSPGVANCHVNLCAGSVASFHPASPFMGAIFCTAGTAGVTIMTINDAIQSIWPASGPMYGPISKPTPPPIACPSPGPF